MNGCYKSCVKLIRVQYLLYSDMFMWDCVLKRPCNQLFISLVCF